MIEREREHQYGVMLLHVMYPIREFSFKAILKASYYSCSIFYTVTQYM